VRWLDRYQKARREARAREHLAAVERAAIRPVAAAPVAPAVAPEAAVAARPVPPRRVDADALWQRPPESARESVLLRLIADLLAELCGSRVRFLVGAVLLAVALVWLHQRELLPDTSNLEEGWRWRDLWEKGQVAEPLRIPLLPEAASQALCSLGAVIAGLVLLVSALWQHWKIGLLTLLGAAVMVVGPVSGRVPAAESLSPFLLCLVVGGGLMVLGFVFGRGT
jgi:hypothetical protein